MSFRCQEAGAIGEIDAHVDTKVDFMLNEQSWTSVGKQNEDGLKIMDGRKEMDQCINF